MKPLIFQAYLTMTAALALGRNRYGEWECAPTEAQLASLLPEERAGLVGLPTLDTTDTTWEAFIEAARAHWSKQQADRDEILASAAPWLALPEEEQLRVEERELWPLWLANSPPYPASKLPEVQQENERREAVALQRTREARRAWAVAALEAPIDQTPQGKIRTDSTAAGGWPASVDTDLRQQVFARREEAMARLEAAARAEREAEEARQTSERLALLDELVKKCRSAEKLERWQAGVLPEAEVEQLALDGWLPALVDTSPHYVDLEASDYAHDEDCCVNDTCFKVDVLEMPQPMSARMWERWQRVMDGHRAVRDCRVDLVRHTAYCEDPASCRHKVYRWSARVLLERAGLRLVRHYAL